MEVMERHGRVRPDHVGTARLSARQLDYLYRRNVT